MRKLQNALLMLLFAALITTGCKKDENDPPVVNNNNNECPDGMTGPDCETEIRAQYIGEYEGEDQTTNEDGETTTYDAVVNITASEDAVDEIDIELILESSGIEVTSTFKGVVDENGITIPEYTITQEVLETTLTTTTSGSGSLEGTTLTLNQESESTLNSENPIYTTSVVTAEKQ